MVKTAYLMPSKTPEQEGPIFWRFVYTSLCEKDPSGRAVVIYATANAGLLVVTVKARQEAVPSNPILCIVFRSVVTE